MKHALFCVLLVLAIFAVGCSSSKSASTTPVAGNWTINGVLQCGQACGSGVDATYQVTFVSSP